MKNKIIIMIITVLLLTTTVFARGGYHSDCEWERVCEIKYVWGHHIPICKWKCVKQPDDDEEDEEDDKPIINETEEDDDEPIIKTKKNKKVHRSSHKWAPFAHNLWDINEIKINQTGTYYFNKFGQELRYEQNHQNNWVWAIYNVETKPIEE